MTISWIEKLFHGFRPEHRSLSPERDIVPRSVLITPPKARTISTPLRTEPLRTAQRTKPAAPSALHETGVCAEYETQRESTARSASIGSGSGETSGCGSSSDSSSCSSGD